MLEKGKHYKIKGTDKEFWFKGRIIAKGSYILESIEIADIDYENTNSIEVCIALATDNYEEVVIVNKESKCDVCEKYANLKSQNANVIQQLKMDIAVNCSHNAYSHGVRDGLDAALAYLTTNPPKS